MKRTEARLKALAALRLDSARGPHATGLTLAQIKSLSGYTGKPESLQGVMKRLCLHRMVKALPRTRPRRYVITAAGQRAAGSFPARGEARADTFNEITKGAQGHA
jgi:hypothetical protein